MKTRHELIWVLLGAAAVQAQTIEYDVGRLQFTPKQLNMTW